VENISALDLNEMAERFSTAMMFGKLANIGDDIGDEFLMGKHVSNFKKIVTGNRIKAEFKGADAFDFEPYTKLLFAANTIPRMRDQTGAVLRRLIIIPFRAKFTKNDPDFDPYIKYKLTKPSAMEYFVAIAIEGLRRVLENQGFTTSEAVEQEIREYELDNNPVKGFLEQVGEDGIVNHSLSFVYMQYAQYAANNGMKPMGSNQLAKQIEQVFGLKKEGIGENCRYVRS
jgi:putative DNA primase/helicase